jgi:ABC-type glycerol-3-phosphate transport system permease component
MIMLMVPDITMIIPRFELVTKLGLRNSLWGLIVVYVAEGLR